MTKLHRRIVILFSAAIAILGFLSINEYVPDFSLIFNIMHSQIGMCIESEIGSGNRNYCDTVIPYRLLLGICILIVIVAVTIPIKGNEPRSPDQ
jgi:hypothetical protein